MLRNIIMFLATSITIRSLIRFTIMQPKSIDTKLFSTNVSSSMKKVFLLQYEYVENMVEKRTPHREGHLALAKEWVEQDLIKAGGAFPVKVDGALFIFNSTYQQVEEFVEKDPYVKAGLVPQHTIKEWTVAVGKI